MSIVLSNISKNFGDFSALHDIDLEIPEGELVALLGPSGCGKTTLLRIIAGLEQTDKGHIFLNGEDKTQHHVSQRGIGFVFQHYALFRHMTVFDNVAFGMRVKDKKIRPTEAEITKKTHALLELVQLDWLHNRFPDQLSGGQRQRIALARALAVEPSVLLLDEPFGALDASVRKDLRQWLRNLHHELNVTSIFVTHDQEEALEVADRVVVINKGQIEQVGSPQDVYDNPVSPFVYRFLGNVNQFHSHVHEGGAKIGDLELKLANHQTTQNSEGLAFVRPHDIEIDKQARKNQAGFAAVVSYVHAIGPLVRVELQRSGEKDLIEAELTQERYRELAISQGQSVFIYPRNVRVFLNN